MNGTELVAVLSQSGSSFTLDYWRSSYGRQEGDDAYFYLTDHLGSTRAILRDNNTVSEAYDFYPFGAAMPGRNYGSQDTKERFTGKEHDETGMDYFGARYYMSGIGRWMGVDPMADSYPGWSTYNYALNSPMYFVDPDGQKVQICHTTSRENEDGSTVEDQECVEYSADMGYKGTNGFISQAIEALNRIFGSAAGAHVLEELIGSAEVYGITNIPITRSGVVGAYNIADRTFRTSGFNITNVSHELFHAFQQEVEFIAEGDRRIDAEVGAYLFQEIVDRQLGSEPYYLPGGADWAESYKDLLDKGYDQGQYERAVRSFPTQSTHNKPDYFGNRAYDGFVVPATLSPNPPIQRFLQ